MNAGPPGRNESRTNGTAFGGGSRYAAPVTDDRAEPAAVRGPGLAAVCLVAVALRVPTFRYSLVSDDEAIYDAMAQVVVRGGTMYRDTVDHKPPGLAYTYSAVHALITHLGGSFGAVMASVHVLGIAVVVLTCVALHAVAREMLEPRFSLLPPLLYAFASAASVPPDSLAVNGELLMNLPTTLAVVSALRGAREDRAARRLALFTLAGVLVSTAALYKYQAAFVVLALVFLGDTSSDATRQGLGPRLLALLAVAVGLAIPFAVAGLYFAERGGLPDALRWGIAFNTHYLAEGPDFAAAAARLGMQLLGVVLPSALLYGASLLGLSRLLTRHRQEAPSVDGVVRAPWLLVVWALTSLFAVTLGRRFFGHYFLQAELPLSLLAAAPVATLRERWPRLTVAALAVPATVFFTIAALPEVFGRYVYAADPDYGAVGRAVSASTKPGDTIWVWGNVPQVYFTAERRPGVRFTFCNYLTGLSPGSRSELDPTYDSRQNAVPGAWDMVVHDLDTNRPAIIVDTAAGGMKSYGKYPVASFPVFAAYLANHYRAEGSVDGAVLYRRADEEAPGSLAPRM